MNVCDQPDLPARQPRTKKGKRVLTEVELEAMRAANRQWHRDNPERTRARHRLWNARNKERNTLRRRAYHLWNHYGLTLAQYQALGDACAICGALRGAKNRRLHVDHDHSTGRIRGLLCSGCNAAIGSLKEDPALFIKALGYLELHRGQTDGLIVMPRVKKAVAA